MSTREQQRRRAAPPELDLDAEREVDLGRYWTAILARWWLPVAGLVAGAIIGYLLALGGTQVYRAQAVVYLGQPLGIQGGTQVPSPNTNPSTARAIVKSESVILQVAHDSGLSPATLRSGTSVNAIAGNVAKVGQNPLVNVSVKGPKRVKVRTAANEFAQILVARLSGYAKTKISTLTAKIASDRAGIDQINKALVQPDVSSTDKLILQLRLTTLEDDLTTAIQLKALAEDVEAPRILSRAAAQQTTARSRRNSVAVGAVIGLILGILVALLWDPVARRRTL